MRVTPPSLSHRYNNTTWKLLVALSNLYNDQNSMLGERREGKRESEREREREREKREE